MQPKKAILADINDELINVYKVMRDNPKDLRMSLEDHQNMHNNTYYYNIREAEYSEPLKKASRFLYLNRACYNGMYRVNKKGKFNVPIGTKEHFLYDTDQFEKYSQLLRNTEIMTSDFGNIIQRAKENDLIFADPPYTVAHIQGRPI